MITVRYFAAAKAAVGLSEERRDDADTIGDLLTRVAGGAPDAAATAAVFARCSFLHNGRATTDPRTPLAPGDTLDVLPPFAGG
ncbi:MoaD/ThiS family protein [Herbiconiux sp. P18]|uniref:MoaD/ThiS family protein n=1 Tax=Herbiconiux liangxiaofengii TaxID=3342795 RepID=UPI0035B904BE